MSAQSGVSDRFSLRTLASSLKLMIRFEFNLQVTASTVRQ